MLIMESHKFGKRDKRRRLINSSEEESKKTQSRQNVKAFWPQGSLF